MSVHTHRLLVRQRNLARWCVALENSGKMGIVPVPLLKHLLGVSGERVRQLMEDQRLGVIPGDKVLPDGPDWCDVLQVFAATGEWDAGRYLMSHGSPGSLAETAVAVRRARGA